jgi:hypothetical protein
MEDLKNSKNFCTGVGTVPNSRLSKKNQCYSTGTGKLRIFNMDLSLIRTLYQSTDSNPSLKLLIRRRKNVKRF